MKKQTNYEVISILGECIFTKPVKFFNYIELTYTFNSIEASIVCKVEK